ncbi:aspartate aminotransferase family protein [soil metagenome]
MPTSIDQDRGSARGDTKQAAPTHVLHKNTRELPVKIARGAGAYVWDEHGTKYLDASSGLNVVVGIGHGVPEVIDAMKAQAELITFCGGFSSEPQEQLARAIAERAPGDLNYVRFTSGGSEAAETAIKLARQYFLEQGKPSKWKVIGRWKSFHGNTLGALAASGHTWRRSKYTPYLADFPHISPAYALEDAEALEAAILNEGPDDIAAFIAEPVVGAADFGRMAPPGYYERIREICDQYDILFITDEVMTGFGRTGKFWGIQHWDATPDIMTFAKGASSGYIPLGGVVISDRIHAQIDAGTRAFEHGHTYNGNPLACAVGLAVLKYIDDHNLVEASATNGEYLLAELRSALAHKPNIGDVVGAGMMNGIEIVADKKPKLAFPESARILARIGAATRARGILINPGFDSQSLPTDPQRIGVCPPLIFTREQIDQTVAALAEAIDEVITDVTL